MKKNKLAVSLIIPHYQNMFSTFYTLEIIKEVSKAAIALGVDLFIDTIWRVPRVSGILFADAMGNEQWIKKARKEGIPHLVLNYYSQDPKDNCISIDNEKAAFEAVEYLIHCGHKRIAIITGKLSAQAGLQRLEGYQRVLKAANIKSDKRYIINADWSEESGRVAMNKLLALKLRPTAVFACGDEMAIGAIKAVKEAGLKVPANISLVGFDNMPQAAFPQFSLTTVQQPFSDLAELGIKYLVQIIKKETRQPVKILLTNTKLIKRESAKQLKG